MEVFFGHYSPDSTQLLLSAQRAARQMLVDWPSHL